MSARIISVGLAGELPPGHAFAELAKQAVDPMRVTALPMPPILRRERKIRVLVEAAERALAGAATTPEALGGCALVVVTRWDGQPTNMIDPETNAIIPFTDIPPTTVGFSFVSHMAASCIPQFLKVRGPAVSLASREGLAAAWRIAERWLGHMTDLALVIESDLALPSCIPSEFPVPSDYALAVLLGKEGA